MKVFRSRHLGQNSLRSVIMGVLGLKLACSALGSGVVTNFTDSALRAALSNGGTVSVSGNGTILLTNTLLITKDSVLDGSGNAVTISGGNNVRLFYVATNVSFTLKRLTLADGRIIGTNGANGDPPFPGQNVRGAGIFSLGGNVALDGCSLTNNYLRGGDAGSTISPSDPNTAKGGDAIGAAVYAVGGRLSLTNCFVGDNSVLGGTGSLSTSPVPTLGQGGQALGGAIYCENGTATFQNVTFVTDSAQGGAPWVLNGTSGSGGLGAGGSLYISNSTVVIAASAFTNNNAMGGGTPPGTAATFAGLPAGDGIGGAVFLSPGSTGVIQRAFFTTNSVVGGNGGKFFASGAGRGGAVFSAGNLRIFESTFANDNSMGGSYSGSGAQPGQGGAICSTGELDLTGCTLLSNYAVGGTNFGSLQSAGQPGAGQGGGIWSSGTLLATNSTVTANHATGGENLNGGASGPASGGGICIQGGSASLVNITTASNRADSSTNFGSVGLTLGGGVFVTNANVSVRNSIIANSANGFDVWGAVIDLGYNICSDGTAGFSALGSLNQVDPMLSALSQNGGPTPTMALLAGSPARDAIPSGFPATDQRGIIRPQGPAADIGAVEADFISSSPTISIQPIGGTVRAGTNFTLSVGASGTAPLFYQWYKDTNLISGATSSQLALSNVQAAAAGTYFVVVSNTFGTMPSQNAVLVVDSTPLLLSQPASVIVPPGGNAYFDVSADGPSLTYQWWHDEVAVPGATGASLAVSNATAGAQGSYFVVVSNFAGSATSQIATLSFDSSALSILVQPQDTSARVGYPASFSVVASGVPPLSYQWQHDGKPITGATNSSYPLAAVATNDAGGYAVVITNGYRAVTSTLANLVVTPGPAAPKLAVTTLGANLVITFQAEAGQSYLLLSSTNLVSWSAVATNSAVLSGTLQFIQPFKTSGAALYRVSTQ